jgi:dihydrosphingosine 1-phosphate phosphatase
MVLPPTFRFAAHIFTLPNRRFYTPATDYERVPIERGLHPIPSVIDLGLSPSVSSQASASLPRFGSEGLKSRKAPGNESPDKGAVRTDVSSGGVSNGPEGGRKHYDADGEGQIFDVWMKALTYVLLVLTRAMVYAGIGMIASEGGPVVFQFLGWS